MNWNIEPAQITAKVLKRVASSSKIVDAPVFSLYNIGRRLKSDPCWGETYVSDVVGCNFRCAHCWVNDSSLNGNLNSEFLSRKFSELPAQFSEHKTQEADAVFDYLQKKSNNKEEIVFAFTGGETTLYRGGLQRIAERIKTQDKDIKLGIDTNGWLIAQKQDYLDSFKGFEEVVHFYVSIKGTNPESFSRFTGVKPEYFESPFIALERLLKAGFRAIPGGVVLNTLAYEQNPSQVAEVLHNRLTLIHPELPKTLSYHRISMQVHDQQQLSNRMKSRGYAHTKPSEFERILLDYFKKKKTEIIRAIPGIKSKKEVIERIIADLRR